MDQERKQLLVTLATFGLALGFLASGALKLVRADIEVEAFQAFRIPLWLMTVVGVGEIVTAGLLLVPRTTTLGAIMGVGIMSVAIPAHVVAGEAHMVPMPLLFMAGFITVGWQRRDRFARWIAPRG